jgi:hypothetical protein
MMKANAIKNTLLQAAQGNTETKACKRVFFLPPKKTFSLPSFFNKIIFPLHGLCA